MLSVDKFTPALSSVPSVSQSTLFFALHYWIGVLCSLQLIMFTLNE